MIDPVDFAKYMSDLLKRRHSVHNMFVDLSIKLEEFPELQKVESIDNFALEFYDLIDKIFVWYIGAMPDPRSAVMGTSHESILASNVKKELEFPLRHRLEGIAMIKDIAKKYPDSADFIRDFMTPEDYVSNPLNLIEKPETFFSRTFEEKLFMYAGWIPNLEIMVFNRLGYFDSRLAEERAVIFPILDNRKEYQDAIKARFDSNL